MDGAAVERSLKLSMGKSLASVLPWTLPRGLIQRPGERDPSVVQHGIASSVAATRTLDTMPFDLPVTGHLKFEHLAGLFASPSLDHGVLERRRP
jgi:hypothetical protein